jgi:hypothetical protein
MMKILVAVGVGYIESTLVPLLLSSGNRVRVLGTLEHGGRCLHHRVRYGGIEAARLGIPVLTGGTSLYHNKGFTVDSNTREEYLDKVRNIEDIRPLSSAQRKLAERFAYASFLMRPWIAKSVTLRYTPDTRRFMYQGQVRSSLEKNGIRLTISKPLQNRSQTRTN